MLLTEDDLHTYQITSLKNLYENDHHYLVAPMGAGKTVISATAILDLLRDGVIKRPLVVAPKRVAQFVWHDNELNDWEHLCGLRTSLVLGSAAKRIKALRADADLWIATYDNLQWLVKRPDFAQFDLILFDEASRLKNPKGKRSKAMFARLKETRPKIIWGMGGSPAPNGVPDLFNQAKVITLGDLWGESYWKWQRAHYWQDQYTYKLTPKTPATEQGLREDFATIASEVPVSAIPREEGETHVQHPFALTVREQEAYSSMHKDYIAFVRQHGIAAANSAVAVNKLRQITSGFIFDTEQDEVVWLDKSRFDALDELIEQTDEPLLVAYQFVPELEELLRRYPGTPYLGGGVSDKAANEAVDGWNKQQHPLMFIHPQSAGHGLNLQHGGRQICWLSLPWSLEAYEQTTARLSRQGQQHQVMVHYIMGNSTIDHRVLTALRHKTDVQSAVIDEIRRTAA